MHLQQRCDLVELRGKHTNETLSIDAECQPRGYSISIDASLFACVLTTEGLYGTVQAILPVFKEKMGWKGRIIVVSPPIYSRFFRGKTAYAIGKVGMSVLTKGLAMDFERAGRTDMAITSIWPATVSSVEN